MDTLNDNNCWRFLCFIPYDFNSELLAHIRVTCYFSLFDTFKMATRNICICNNYCVLFGIFGIIRVIIILDINGVTILVVTGYTVVNIEMSRQGKTLINHILAH